MLPARGKTATTWVDTTYESSNTTPIDPEDLGIGLALHVAIAVFICNLRLAIT